ncbi:MAG: TolC family protein [Prevotella sp.]|jgi:outer membrane protein|nr:TolC family protein [Prevotella sp.]
MRHIAFFCLLFVGISAQSQKEWTLRQCIDHAVENNISIKQQALNVENAEIDLSTSKNSRLPSLGAGLSQSFSFGRSSMGNNVIESVNSSNTSFSISSSMPLFTGFRIPNETRKNELNLQAAIETLKKAKDDIALQVASAYLETLFKKELLKVYQEQAELSRIQVERTKTLVEAGKAPESQLFDIEAQLAKDELNITNAANDLSMSLLNLSQALNIRDAASFDVAEPVLGDVIEKNLSSILPVEQIYQASIAIKPQVKEQEYLLESSKKNLKIAESGHWPTLDLSMGYSTSFQHVFNIGNNQPFSTQIRDRGSEYIGLSLNIPIFNRFETRNRVRAARLNIQNYELSLDNAKLTLYKEIQQAYQSAVSAQARYNSTEKACASAAEAFKYAEERYNVGKSTVFEYTEARTKLLSSKSEQVQAKYDFLFRAKILDFYRGIEINIE